MVHIFWQGIISIHQKTFLEQLALQPTVTKVIMIVEQDITPYRQNMGWEIPQIHNVTIIRSPKKIEIENIFIQYPDAVHVLGGIRVGKMMSLALAAGIKNKAKMGSLSEPYDKTGVKGKVRDLKYMYLKKVYFKHIDFFLAVGKEGVKTYTGLGFNPQRVFPWAYFITVNTNNEGQRQVNNPKGGLRIIYAGRIEENKGIFRFVQQLSKAKNKDYELAIYGDGKDKEKLMMYINENSLSEKIHFFPFMKHKDLVMQYANYDWVVLPSIKKDGWGVIVSEGFLNGLKAICSNICGVSWAIKDNFNGVTFDWTLEGSCKTAIDKMFLESNYANKSSIISWAKTAVSGEAGAKYYLEIIDSIYFGKSMPNIPWI